MADSDSIEWRPVRGHESRYEVSNTGLVRSLDYTTSNGHFWKSRVLKPIVTHGYCYIVLASSERRAIHRMIAEAFLGAPPTAAHTVNHKNGVKGDNRAANLEWCTQAENNQHGWQHGLLRGARKLTKSQAAEIRQLRAAGWTFVRLCSRFNVGSGTIQRAVKRTHGY